jgi:3-phosphoshikimate 1-carboxyvinyltransferase
MSARSPEFSETQEITPLPLPPRVTVTVPGSKSITNRALVLAALSGPLRSSQVCRVVRCEDTEIMVDALKELGFHVEPRWKHGIVHVSAVHSPTPIPATQAKLFVGNSGTSMRFLTALVSLGHGTYEIDGVARMRERPIEDLLVALRQLGVKAESIHGDGYPPVRIQANGLQGGIVRIRGDVSSQFLSGLLMAAPLARGDITIEVQGRLVSRPYVDMTVTMMRRYGVQVATFDATRFCIPSNQQYPSLSYVVEPDATAASYFLAAAAITGGEVEIPGIGQTSLQGDVRFAYLMQEMGCHVLVGQDFIRVAGFPLRGIEADMNELSDCVMTLASVACFAEGPTTIRNVAHIRHKETDRLRALATELRRLGADVEEFADGLQIIPRPLHGAVTETYNDHRIAMSMALIGLRVPGVVIQNPGCVAKTYPRFFEDLRLLYRRKDN